MNDDEERETTTQQQKGNFPNMRSLISANLAGRAHALL
jgi:hypothetical protein